MPKGKMKDGAGLVSIGAVSQQRVRFELEDNTDESLEYFKQHIPEIAQRLHDRFAHLQNKFWSEVATLGLTQEDTEGWGLDEVWDAIRLTRELRERFDATVSFPSIAVPHRRGPKPKLTGESLERARRLFDRGKTPLQIAMAIGVSDRTIQRYIKSNWDTKSPRGPQKKGTDLLTEEEYVELRHLIEAIVRWSP